MSSPAIPVRTGKKTPSIVSRLLAGLKDSFAPSSSAPFPSVMQAANGAVLDPGQIQELCVFIEEAKMNRDQVIPELEAGLAEANAAVAQSAKLVAELEERLSKQLRLKEEIPFLRIPSRPSTPVAAKPAQEPTDDSQDGTLDALIVDALAGEIKRIEGEREELREQLERYEVGIALYKGDMHMLLSDALIVAFASDSYKLLDPGLARQTRLPCPQLTVAEPDPEPSIHATVSDVPICASTIHVPPGITEMMAGCWMYKYPRSRFHRLINLPCVPLGSLTYRFIWFCPVNRCIYWAAKPGASSCKMVTRIKHAFGETRQLGKDESVEVIVVVPEEGRPLALVPTCPADFFIWKEGLVGLRAPDK